MAGAYVFVRFLLPYLWPFVLGLLLALAIEPVVRGLQRFRLSRPAAVLVALALVLGLFFALVTWAVSTLVVEITKLVESLPAYYQTARQLVADLTERAGQFMATLPPEVNEQIYALLARLYAFLGRALPEALFSLAALPQVGIVTLVAAVASYFIGRDLGAIGAFFLDLLPPGWRDHAASLAVRLMRSVGEFAFAQLILIALTTAITIAGLALLGVPYALMLGLLSGLLDVLPVLGPGLLFVPWMLYHFIWGRVALGVGLGLLYLGISVARQVAQPRVVGERLGIHPLAALLSMYVGARLLGVLGLAVGPLVVMLLSAMRQAGILTFGAPPGGGGGRA
jgi:sporulation integral membrane protein YtvI